MVENWLKKILNMKDFLVPCLVCCSRLYFVLKCFLMKVLCHLSVSPLIGIYNNEKIENILNSNFLLEEKQAGFRNNEIYLILSINDSTNDHLVLAKIESSNG